MTSAYSPRRSLAAGWPNLMRTLGVDLASQPKDTATCEIEWEAGKLSITTPADDDAIVEAAERVRGDGGVVAIDAPFGWPTAFVEAIERYRAEGRFGDPHRPELRLRATDREVQGRPPLSVSTDRIGIVAFRAAHLLDRLGSPRRDGSDRVIEVYPAVALRQWGLELPGYKLDPAVRDALLTRLAAKLPRLQIAPCRQQLVANADALDSLIAALVARAKHLGRVVAIPPQHADTALREGWLWVPTPDALERMAGEAG
jgi:predicted nuclease with RNAse H fold